MEFIKNNLAEVEANICRACEKAGRDRKEVTLIAVSKTKPVEMLEACIENGIDVFGENKVQELCGKYEVLPKDLQWHLIGHLQRNKVKYITDKVELIHSVDSIRLAEAISEDAVKKGVNVDIIEGVATVAITLNLKYGYNIMDISGRVQEKVKVAVENMTGLTVADVNVRVAGIEVEA